MQVIKMYKPKVVQNFINLLWANLPQDWVVKFTYYQKILFISIIMPTTDNDIRKVRRQYDIEDIKDRKEDLWGLAADCAEEIMHYAESIKNQS